MNRAFMGYYFTDWGISLTIQFTLKLIILKKTVDTSFQRSDKYLYEGYSQIVTHIRDFCVLAVHMH